LMQGSELALRIPPAVSEVRKLGKFGRVSIYGLGAWHGEWLSKLETDFSADGRPQAIATKKSPVNTPFAGVFRA